MSKFDMYDFVPAVGKSCGLLLAWKSSINLQIIVSSPNFISCIVFHPPNNTPWQLTCVYSPLIYSQQRFFWDTLDKIVSSFTGAWMVIGDFNVVPTSEDKIGGQVVAESSKGGLRRVINNNGLIDVGFEGFAFTWNNRLGGLANIQERLDRGFSNETWKLMFPHALITHLSALQSDHKPLHLQLNPPTDNLLELFKFE